MSRVLRSTSHAGDHQPDPIDKENVDEPANPNAEQPDNEQPENEELDDQDNEPPRETSVDPSNLAYAINLMTEELRRRQAPPKKTKAKEPDTFDGSDSRKLNNFILLCNLYF